MRKTRLEQTSPISTTGSIINSYIILFSMNTTNTLRVNKARGMLADGICEVWKERGETLAELLKRFRYEKGFPGSKPITYAGRLDPMAEGVVLLLYGNARFEKDAHLRKTKTYEVEILFGVATDTLDPLGVIEKCDPVVLPHEKVTEVVHSMSDITSLPYPLYSSRPVEGIPLFVHARKGTSVAVPDKKVVIHAVEVLDIKEVDLIEYAQSAIEDIGRVVGDFRQEECKDSWAEVAKRGSVARCTLATISVTASSGTYMRSLAAWCGDKLGIPAIAFCITRTKIGD